MPYADLARSRIFYLVDGPEEAPWLVLSNSLGANADMWLALAHPQQVDQLILCNTSSRMGSTN